MKSLRIRIELDHVFPYVPIFPIFSHIFPYIPICSHIFLYCFPLVIILDPTFLAGSSPSRPQKYWRSSCKLRQSGLHHWRPGFFHGRWHRWRMDENDETTHTQYIYIYYIYIYICLYIYIYDIYILYYITWDQFHPSSLHGQVLAALAPGHRGRWGSMAMFRVGYDGQNLHPWRIHGAGLPSGNDQHSYWTWPFIVDLPIKNGAFP